MDMLIWVGVIAAGGIIVGACCWLTDYWFEQAINYRKRYPNLFPPE